MDSRTECLYYIFSIALTFGYYLFNIMSAYKDDTSKKALARKLLFLPIFFFISIPYILFLALRWTFVNAFSKEVGE